MLKRRAGRALHARATPARPSCPSAPHLRPLSAAPTLIRRRYCSADDSVGWPARCGAVSRPPSARGDRARAERRCSWLAVGPAAQPPCHAQARRSRRRAAAGGRERRARRPLSAAARGLPEELRRAAAAWRERAARALRRRVGHLRCWGEAHDGGGQWGGRWAAVPASLGLYVCFRCVWWSEGVAPCVMRGLVGR